MKKGLTAEPGRKMVVLDERTIYFYDPRIEVLVEGQFVGILTEKPSRPRKKKT
jgi:hypothetical protein